MFTGLKPYPEYVAATLPWVDGVPVSWRFVRAKNALRTIDVRSLSGEEELLTVSSARGVVRRASTTVSMFQAGSYAGHKLCWPGDLVINSLWAWGRGLGVSPHYGIVSTAYGVYRARRDADLTPDFLHELVRSKPFQWELQVRSKGVWKSRLQLTDDSFLCAPLPLPPHRDQEAIVRFLDHANVRIGRAIAAKRKMIALIMEQNQVCIRDVITRGLDGSASPVASDVPWMSEVPSHWCIEPIAAFASLIQTGPFGSQLHAGEYIEDGVPVVNPSHLSNGVLAPDRTVSVEAAKAEQLGRHRLKEGDIVVARRGELGRCSVVSDAETGWICGTGSMIVRLRTSVIDPWYFQLAFSSAQYKDALGLESVGATMGNINAGVVSRLQFARPPLDEQVEIVNFVRDQSRRDAIRSAVLIREIGVINEFRTRLTADVVTGQLDVREAASKLPDLDPGDLASADVDDSEDIDAVAEEFLDEDML
jgi:type I restriction enzyme S subunit